MSHAIPFEFAIQDVAGALVAKMHARHPHLYGDGIKRDWEAMKAEKTRRSSLDEGLPSGLPGLHRAHRLQDRAAGVGSAGDDVHDTVGEPAFLHDFREHEARPATWLPESCDNRTDLPIP